MTPIREMIEGCIAGNQEQLAKLCGLIREIAPKMIHPILSRWRQDHSLADDIRQEFWLHLQEDEWRRLRLFDGGDEQRFQGWLCTALRNFCSDLLSKEEHRKRKGERAAQQKAKAVTEALFEQAIMARLQELYDIMTTDHQARLVCLLSLEDADRLDPKRQHPRIEKCARTQQLWKKGLIEEYGPRLWIKPS